MSDYQQSSIVGTRWKRARRISIDNPLNGAPSVLFAEDEVMALGDGATIERPVSNLTAGYDPGHSFPLRDPATGEEIPGQTGTQAQLYALLYSAYWALALERDGC